MLLMLAAVPAALTGWLHPKRPVWAWTRPAVEQVDLSTIERWPPPVLWVDAREASAYAMGHIPGAVQLDETEWQRQMPDFLAAWRPESRVVVYCDTERCNSSQEVALRLQRELSLSEIFVLKGGWNSWQQSRR